MTDSTQTFELSTAAAEAYEQTFVPALLADWAHQLVDLARIEPGQAVLDVACGTGIVARTAADRVGLHGRVVGLDRNEEMLEVARRIRPDIEWHHGDAADLPFGAGSFDTVLCQAGLMYFPERVAALREMARVVTEKGTVAVQVWGSLESQPVYRRFAEVVARHAGPEAIDLVGSYFCLGDLDALRNLFLQAGLKVITTHTRLGAVRFDSMEEFIRAEIDSTPLIDRLDEATYARIVDDCCDALADFRAGDGRPHLPIEGHLVAAGKV